MGRDNGRLKFSMRSVRDFVIPASVALTSLVILLYLRKTTTQSRSLDQEIVPGVGWGTPSALLHNFLNFPQLFLAIVGIGINRHDGWSNLAFLGRFQISIPTSLNLLIFSGLIAIASFQFGFRPRIKALRLVLNSRLLLNTALLLLIMAPYLVALQRSGFRIGAWIQPRYVAPGFIAFCVSTIVPLGNRRVNGMTTNGITTTRASHQHHRELGKPYFVRALVVAVMLVNIINLRATSRYYSPTYVDVAALGGLLGNIANIFKTLGLAPTAVAVSFLGLIAFLGGDEVRPSEIK
jgi:hypothetical protein